jgi:SNF2 family DNA or RNA helicase
MSLDFETEEEREFYQGIQGKLVKRWRSLDRDQTTMRFQLLMKLRQLSIHPQIYIGARKREPFGYARDSWYAPSTKFTAIQKLVSKQTGVRWIIFCQFRDEMDLLENELSDYTVIQYHGGLSEEQKVAALKATEEPVDGNMVLLLNIKSGGVGLNLQHFTKIIFVSPWWTSALMRQAVGRAVRIGQTEKVQVYHMILKEEETLNIDAMMRERMEEKEELLVEVLKGASRGLAYVTPTKRYEERQEESMEPETTHPVDQEVDEDP